MDNTKRGEILLKVIERIYEQHPNMQSTIGSKLVVVYREENVCPKTYFLLFPFYHNEL